MTHCLPGIDLDGVEIPLSMADLLGIAENGMLQSFSPSLREQLHSLPANSIHLDHLSNLPSGQELAFVRALIAVYEMYGMTEFTIHPDGVPPERWSRVLTGLPSEMSLSIENMDIRKAGFQTLSEIENLLSMYPTLTCTFDSAHWLEAGRDLSSAELRTFFQRWGDRVSKIHFSVPTSRVAAYKRYSTFHCCASWSGIHIPEEFFEMAAPPTHWVIEGLIPTGSDQLLKSEISFLRMMTEGVQQSVGQAG